MVLGNTVAVGLNNTEAGQSRRISDERQAKIFDTIGLINDHPMEFAHFFSFRSPVGPDREVQHRDYFSGRLFKFLHNGYGQP